MNILILNWRDKDHPSSGGAEIVTHEHGKSWVERGHKVTWFTSWYAPVGRVEYVDGIRMIRRGGFLTVYPVAMLYVLLHGHEYDVIVDEVHGFPFFAVFFTKTPVVVFIHEIAGIIWDYMYPFPVNVIGKFVEKHYFRLYKHCQFWTDAPSTIEELVARGIPRKQCTAIACPITVQGTWDNEQGTKSGKQGTWGNEQGTENREPAPTRTYSDRGEQRTENRKQNNPTYIFVSRVVKMKGIEEVIKAFSFIIREQPSCQLRIVGGGEERYIKELKAMISDYGVSNHVTFFGKVTEQKKYALMARSHLLLHASVKEGWGLVVLEAASVGTPSIVYDVPGLRDVVKNRKTGMVVKSNSPQEMAKEALRLMSNNKRYAFFQKNGKAWVHSLRWSDVTKSSLALLHRSVHQGTYETDA